MKKSWKALLGAAGGFASAGAVAYLFLRARSTGEIEPYLDDEGNPLAGSVAEITKVEIGGRQQGMILKGRSDKNPVLLFLHGGPGTPEYLLMKHFPLNLEDYFTVCWWDQRGSGLSYAPDIGSGELTVERMVEDTIEVTNYLRERFGKEKIYLMGHSWGTFLGIHAAQLHPALYEAYIGIGQVVCHGESQKLTYAHMTETARAQGDLKTAQKLEALQEKDSSSTALQDILLVNATLFKQGGGMFHDSKKIPLAFLRAVMTKEYTLADKINFFKGAALTISQPAWDTVMSSDLSETIPALEIPVHIIHGVYDMQTSYDMAKAYFERLIAPEKHFHVFENSAHSPPMEEPERFMRIIKKDLLKLKSNV